MGASVLALFPKILLLSFRPLQLSYQFIFKFKINTIRLHNCQFANANHSNAPTLAPLYNEHDLTSLLSFHLAFVFHLDSESNWLISYRSTAPTMLFVSAIMTTGDSCWEYLNTIPQSGEWNDRVKYLLEH